MKPTGGNDAKCHVTTSEIARMCGLSRTTVSAVLNGRPSVRESTRRKVLQYVRESHYSSGIIAKAVAGELSEMVAILAPDAGSPSNMMVFRGVSRVLETEGYHMLFHNVRHEGESDPATLASLQAFRPAGYIVLKGAEGPKAVHARKIAEEGVPLVTLGALAGLETHSVNVDNRAAMRLATDYVIRCGHSRLGHIAGPATYPGAKERKLGFIESLVEHGMSISQAAMVDVGETVSAGYEAAISLLGDPVSRSTALLCFNDMVAMGVYRAAHELSLRIPDTLSVMGFGGLDFGALMSPPLTTVNVFSELLGERAARLLLKIIRNGTPDGPVAEWVSPELTERASVRTL